MSEPNILSDYKLIYFSPNIDNNAENQAQNAQYDSNIDKLGSQEALRAFDSMKSKLKDSIILSDDIDDSLNIFISSIENCAAPFWYGRKS